MKDDIVIIIPAYNPDETLYELIQKLKQNEYKKIIVVNDGSSKIEYIQRIKPWVSLIENKTNQGKCMAIKLSMEYCLENFSSVIGIITVDADGQHLVEDINKIYEVFRKNPTSVILGSRDFTQKGIPLKSKIGNRLFSKFLQYKTKVMIRDTQTGLRAIPITYIQQVKVIRGTRFEYETNMLLYYIRNHINIKEVAIKNIYINKNKASNYKPIKDSIKILQQL